MMRKVEYKSCGDVKVLEIVKSPIPEVLPTSDNVLVKVLAIGLNPVDWKLRRYFGNKLLTSFPVTPCADLCGVVEETNKKSKLKKGDLVIGFRSATSKNGTCCEYFLAKEAELCKISSEIPPTEAATVPLVSLTILQAFQQAKLWPAKASNEGKSILIHAGGGGVGSLAIQCAKLLKLKVFTTCSERSKAICERVGADVLINYETEKFEKYEYDYVFDVMGGEYELRGMKCIKSNGYYMTILNSGWATKISSGKTDGVSGAGSLLGSAIGLMYASYRMVMQYITGPYYSITVVKADSVLLQVIGQLLSEGRIKPQVDRVFAFDNVQEAFRYLETGHAHGKVVLELQ